MVLFLLMFIGGCAGSAGGGPKVVRHLLMARYTELIGVPRRVQGILCSSATDLGRERGFQGNGMLDVLRAFQSI